MTTDPAPRPPPPDVFYDDAYFDSDSEGDADEASGMTENEDPHRIAPTTRTRRQRQHVVSNDDLFYDPGADSDDEQWLQTRILKTRISKTSLPAPSATLACPLCMTPLCHDCQQHDLYETQFRAMFFENCVVDHGVQQRFPGPRKKGGHQQQRNRKLGGGVADGDDDDDDDAVFWPVRCEICTTQVGVMDKEEVVHFFNVIAG
ncbi:E2F-associated phosphoprotein [Powellomyces hirtus]|nr:E2F-associated phosphoprotein [Powellomyces hirtus]